MKKFLFTFVAMVCLALNMSAEDYTMRKSTNNISYEGLGANSATTIHAAVQFTNDDVSFLAGAKLTTLRFHIASTENIKTFNLWVKAKCSDSAKLANVTIPVADLQTGINTVTLEEPVEISADSELALGYTYTQTSGVTAYPITTTKTDESSNALMLSLGSGYQDYTSYYGALFIEGIVSGVVVENYSAKITSAEMNRSFYAVGSEAEIAMNVVNSGKAFSSLGITYTCGETNETKNFSVSAGFGQTAEVTLKFNLPNEYNPNTSFSAAITKINGEDFQGETVTAKIPVYNKLYDRTVVIEEGTGTWCGWCVRGIVAMEQMREKYPDTFIGIAAHTSSSTTDPMHLANYANYLGISGFPGCTLDRTYKGLDVAPDAFEYYYQFSREQGSYADFDLVSATLLNGKVTGKVEASFDFDADNADMRMTYVLVEDGITGYSQANYYAGGGYGEMGGYENKPSTVTDQVFNDVARVLAPSFYGTKGSIPAVIKMGETYTNEVTISVPTKVKDKNQLTLVALLVDGASGEIINAHKKKVDVLDAIESVSESQTISDSRVFNINGQCVSTPKSGLYIVNGKKVVL
ncbi:MAG: Omp28-related outer membrane protein [Bacteroidaceae bacterium]|nr:Omp28-related outer membrane protein [Bacteroidaceae bacterium]